MFDDVAVLFSYNVVDAYDRYVAERDAKTAGRNLHLRAALSVAEAAYHFREHLPDLHKKTRFQVTSECDDYRLIADVTNAVKHKLLDRNSSDGPPLVRSADDIVETIICVQFEDEEGTYADAQTETFVTCSDGKTRSLDLALANVINYWGHELVRIGILPSFRARMLSQHGKKHVERLDARSPDLQIDRGLRFNQAFKLLRYNSAKGYAEPVDLSGSNLEFRIYKPSISLDLNLTSPTGEVFKTSLKLSDDESLAYAKLSSEAERKALEARIIEDHKNGIQKWIQEEIDHRRKDENKSEMITVALRPYTAADEDAAIELWRRTWQQHYPHLDFSERVDWWRTRWRNELVPAARIVMAEIGGALVGFVTVDPKTMYLDQIVVAPEHWGSGVALALLDEAKRLSPKGLDLLVNKDNARAIGFYEKHGFAFAGEDKNPVSGKPVNRMTWRGK